MNSSITSNESAEEDDDSNDIHFNISDVAAVQNYANNSMTRHSQEHGEVTLHAKDFYYPSYQHDTMNGNNTCIFNATKSGWKFLAEPSPHVQRRKIN